MVAGDRFDLEQRVERLEALVAVLVAGPHLRGAGGRFRYWLLDDYPDRHLDQIVDQMSAVLSSIDRAERAANSIGEDQRRIEAMIGRVDEQFKAAREQDRKVSTLQQETHTWLSMMSFGVDLDSVPLHRFVPIRAYLSEGHEAGLENFSAAISSLLHALGLYQSDEFPEQRGSWYKKWFAKTADVVTQPEIQQRLERMERALELQGLGKPQAEIDEKLGSALEKIANATAQEKQVAVQVGSLLYVKVTGPDGGSNVAARSLSQAEMIALEKNQHLLMSPKDVLHELYKLCHEPLHEGQGRGDVHIEGDAEDADTAAQRASSTKKTSSKIRLVRKSKSK